MRYIFIILLFSCQPDYMIDSRLSKHVNMFYEEAAKRGKILEKENLVITLKSGLFSTNNRLGIAVFDKDLVGQVTVYIDEEYYLNESIPDECKETTVFHELGHAVLKRKHHTNQVPSIMHSANMYHCYKSDYYTTIDRDYLLNELFQ
jgi:Zn-dependent peptidase ImmA (M78 family)